MQTSLVKKALPRGFTLLELLIVIAILAILAAVVVIVLNPAETLAKSRDAQRLSDLSTVKSAIALYLTTVSSPSLDGGIADTSTASPHCFGTSGTYSSIWYSDIDEITYNTKPTAAGSDATTTANWAGGTDYNNVAACSGGCLAYVNSAGAGSADYTAANQFKTNGLGWIPVNLDTIVGGSPLSNMPQDPSNVVTPAGPIGGTGGTGDKVYRYGCDDTKHLFEIDAVLESNAYTVTDNKQAKDGGDNDNYYEVGNSVRILPATDALF